MTFTQTGIVLAICFGVILAIAGVCKIASAQEPPPRPDKAAIIEALTATCLRMN